MRIVCWLMLFLCSSSTIDCDPIELSDILLHEHASIGYVLVKLNSSSNESNSYRFVSNNHREIQRYFALNSSTGELRLANEIHRQLICTHPHVPCRFILKIFELFHEKLYHVPIRIEDLDEIRPIFLYNASQIEFHLSENSPIYQSKLFIQQGYNHDQKQFKYQLKSSEENLPFILEINNELAHRLALVLTQSLDRESKDSYHCTLQVTDTNHHEEQLKIKILIDDVNDQSPIFESEKYSIELSENASMNTTIVRVYAHDLDIGLNGRITYDFSDASKPYEKIFSIDHQTGFLYLRSLLDYEQRSSYVFYIEARDSGKEVRSSQTLINITVLDENDNYPQINFRFLSELNYNPSKQLLQISETYPIEKFFSQILVTDEDSGLNGHVRLWFETTDDSFHLYQIDRSTHILNRTKPFDFESRQKYHLKFYAEDFHPRNPLQTTQILTIDILDENDHLPQFLQPFYRLSLPENNQLNLILTKVDAFDLDHGENGRISYEILTNQSSFPFTIDSNTGILRCVQSLDREEFSHYRFDVLARDHGYPLSLSTKMPVEILVDDLNDNRPIFEHEKYEFAIEENFPRQKSFGLLRAFDRDFNPKLIYLIENEETFQINHQGELFLRTFVDREMKEEYHLNVTVSDHYFKTCVPVIVRILDINDCRPQWKNPSENQTKLFLNRDLVKIGAAILRFEAIDYDDKSNGNGLVRYSLENSYSFLDLIHSGDLIVNSTPILGRYFLKIHAKDQGQSVQYSSVIFIELFIGDNHTNGSLYIDHFSRLNSLSTIKRVIFLATFFLSMAFILVFIICMILMLICRSRKQKYLLYMKCHQEQVNQRTMIMMIDSNSNSSKLSLENIHSSSPSYTGTTIYAQHQPKPTQTSDYYSNSSKHDEDVDEWTDEQHQRSIVDDQTDWSIEKILYPDWLYRDSTMITPKKQSLTTSTFTDSETNGSTSSQSKRTLSLHTQPSPKQVRFGCEEQVYSYRQLSTTIQQLKARTTIFNAPTAHHTFI